MPEGNDVEQIVANLAWDYCSRKQNDDKFMSPDEYIASKRELFGHPERIANFRTIV